jgi:uncharacterized membrane protein
MDQRAHRGAQVAVSVIVVLGAAVFLVAGAWAFFWPRSFYEIVAEFPPFNLHLFHDAGAFQLGIGAALLAGLFWRDALLVGMFGGTVGAVVHAISHIVDRSLGGNPSDPWTLSVLAGLLVIATGLRLRTAAPNHRQPAARRPGSR